MSNFAILKTLTKNKLLAASLLSAGFVGLFATTSFAGNPTGTITNDDFSIDEGVGNTITLDRVVTVNLDNLVETITETVIGAPNKVDILFLADNTGSMGDEIANVQVNAQDILNDLRAAYVDTTDIKFGVARYYGAPKEYSAYYSSYCSCYVNANSVPGDKKITGTTTVTETTTTTYTYKYWTYYYGYWYKYDFVTLDSDGNQIDSGDVWKWSYNGSSYTENSTENITENVYGDPVEMDSYELQVAIGGTDAEILQAIGTTSSADDAYSWKASGGKDWPEANFFALHQAATSGAATTLGWQTGYDTSWRDDAMKIIVWFGDAPSHTSDTTESEVTTALNNNKIQVVAVNVGSGSNTINKNSQATNITTATTGEYAVSTANNVASTMETLIGNAVDSYTATTTTTTTPIIDIDFRTSNATPIPPGLTVTYVCTDTHPSGCNDVLNGETRNFQMIVEGYNAGSYNFETEVFDIDTSNEVVDADNTINIHNID
ncbi:hypothetical protein Xen7305DRAFT_00022570 [Xenococcus sp. PCC 7305]|uniref:hypothetical protein n=1 Tax=Xenococcus sp. PCC 7305 TaxID=102125 RepID=UPI0002ABE13F|nr:hypothetical protein [Xenococcus sp. PCC 7305]ELS02543.1 hypothetical protein Xen7305DRAFT_00022570 [Xenococcus sp. PCC 7305]